MGYSRRGRVEYLEPRTARHDRGVVAGRVGGWRQAGDGDGGAEGQHDEISSGSAEDEEDCRGVEWREDVREIFGAWIPGYREADWLVGWLRVWFEVEPRSGVYVTRE